VRSFFSSRARTGAAIVIGVLILMAVVAGPLFGSDQNRANTDPSPAASVLDASYAKSVGFSKTYESAKRSAATGQKGCSDSIESVYENLSNKTALISEVLNCKSSGDASASLASGRKEVQIDSSFKVPKELGTSAFASATERPGYLIVWTVGTKVAIAGLDVNIAASSSTSSTVPSKAITQAQKKTLVDAALKQNSLFG
jgi:hypothetical protein